MHSYWTDLNRQIMRKIDRTAFAINASLTHLIPRAVVRHMNSEEAPKPFRYSHEGEIPLTFRCGGAGLSG